MASRLLELPKLFRHVVEDLPMGIYIVDHDRRICFWNHGAEHLTGHLSHEVVGRILDDVVQTCDRHGTRLTVEQRPVTMTIQLRTPQQATVFYLHKEGHRVAVSVRARPILEWGDTIGGAAVMFELAHVEREEPLTMYGCLEATTGIPSRRLTRAVMYECMAGAEKSKIGFGLLQIRLLELEEFRAKHGPQSAVPFLRAAANTIRRSLDSENFLGRWGENEFLVVLDTASPVTVATAAETLWNLLRLSEVSWWGDRFLVKADVTYAVAAPGDDMEALMEKMKPAHSSVAAKAAAAGAAVDAKRSRG